MEISFPSGCAEREARQNEFGRVGTGQRERNPTLKAMQNEIDQGGCVLQVINHAPPGKEPIMHWIRFEGLDCRKPGKVFFSIGDSMEPELDRSKVKNISVTFAN